MRGFVMPRCSHGKIILGCPDDSCPEQNAYLREQDAALSRYQAQMQENARLIVADWLRKNTK